MTDLTIIEARPEHGPLIRAHSDMTFQTHTARLPHAFSDDNAYQHMLIDTALAPKQNGASHFRCILLVATGDDQPMGYVMIVSAVPTGTDQTAAMIADIGVFEGFQRRGIGRALLKHARSRMAEFGWHGLTADVWLDNTASHKMFAAADFTAERTEYRFGTPPIPTHPTSDPSRLTSFPRTSLLILLALAAGLLIYVLS